jgi:6-pyruvoyltetrahydropterin/6-carboxytetrahydropterin synthase
VYRLTRQVRFAVNTGVIDPSEGQIATRAVNGHAGSPTLSGLGYFFTLDVTLRGELDAPTSYLLNIKHVDDVVRRRAILLVRERIASSQFGGGAIVARDIFELLHNAWPNVALDCLSLRLSPYLSLGVLASEHPMVRLSQKFEFSASHRLHNPSMNDAENRASFGKCNNPHGHGHNYELQVTLAGAPDEKTGLLIAVPEFERIVDEAVIQRLDHKNLNVEVPEFAGRIPSVEVIAKTIHEMLRARLEESGAKLASVTVWETPKTWAEYAE